VTDKEKLAVPVTLIIFSILCYLKADDFPPMAARFPKLLIVLMLVFSVALLFEEWRKGRTKPLKEAVPEEPHLPDVRTGLLTTAKARQGLIIAAMIGYLIVLRYLGFLITTFIFLLGQFLLLGYRNKFTSLVAAICTTLIIYFVFTKAFLIMFPEGVILPEIF
jgi:hypothetical protein